jgi:DNA-binding NtrC family response regulator
VTSEQRIEQLGKDGRIAVDLLDRISGVPIELPPLARRREDVPLLVARFSRSSRSRTARPARRSR